MQFCVLFQFTHPSLRLQHKHVHVRAHMNAARKDFLMRNLMCTRTCTLFMSSVNNFVHASVMFCYSGKFVNPEISTGTNVSGLTRHHCTDMLDCIPFTYYQYCCNHYSTSGNFTAFAKNARAGSVVLPRGVSIQKCVYTCA